MNQLDKIYAEQSNPSNFARAYFTHLAQLFVKIDCDAIERFTNLILDAREHGRTIFFIGNGGSAATASHFANDFAIGPRLKMKPIKAVSLADNNAILTAIGNDFGYELLFVKQLEVLLIPNDAVVAISASGNSPNILKGIEYAKKCGATTVGLTGFSGGELRTMVDISLHVETSPGEYGPVEDLHMIFDHLIGSYINRKLAEHP